MSDTNQIARQVLDAREEIIERMFSGPEGQDLIRLDAAYRALTGKEPPSVGAVLGQRNGKVTAPDSWQTESPGDDERWVEVVRRGPKDACRDLMVNGPDREWTYDDLESYFDSEGIIIDAQNPRDAIRTAMASLTRENIVTKVGRGRFRPVRDHSTDDPQQKGDDQQSVESWITEGSVDPSVTG